MRANDSDAIRESFATFYRATILADETDPNKLHDLQSDLDAAQVYSAEQIDEFVKRYLAGADRDQLDPILDACVAVYLSDLDEDGQVDFKGKAKGFVRTYGFLSSVLPYSNALWEKRSIFLNFLIPKLPSPKEEDLSKGILDAIDMDSYRVEKRAMQKIILPDDDAEIEPVPVSGGGHRAAPGWTGCRTSSKYSMSISATFPGKTRTACGSSLPRLSLPEWPRTPHTRMPRRTRKAERPYRARPGAGACDDLSDERRHRVVQAVHG